MKSYASLGVRYIKKNLVASISIILSMVLSISLIVAIGTLSYNAKKADVEKTKYESVRYHVRFDNLTKNQLKILQGNDENIGSLGVYIYYASFNYKNKIFMNVLNANKSYMEFCNSKVLKGKYPTQSGEIALEEWVLENLDLKATLGQRITMDLENINGSVKGQETFELVGILKDSPRGKSTGGANAFICLKDGFNRIDKDMHPMDVCVEFKENIDILSSIDEISKKINVKKDDIHINYMLLESMNMLNETNWDIVIIAFLVTLLSTMIVYSIFNISMHQRIREYGMVKAMGATSRQIFKIILTEMAVLLGIAIPLGLGLGFLGAYQLSGLASQVFTEGVVQINEIVFSYSVILLSLGVTLLSIIFPSIKVSFFISETDTLDIIRDGLKKENESTDRFIKWKGPEHFNILYRVVMLNIMRDKRKFIATVLSMSLGGILFITTSFYGDLLYKNESIQLSTSEINSDYQVYMNPTIPLVKGFSKQNIEEMRNIDGVKKIFPTQNVYTQLILKSSHIKNLEYFEYYNQLPYFKKVLGGLLVQDPYSDDYILKNNFFGYTDDQLNSLTPYLVEGSIDIDKLKSEDTAIVYMPKDQGDYVSDLKIGDEVLIRMRKDGVLIQQGRDSFKDIGNPDEYNYKRLKIGAIVSTLPTKDIYYVKDYSIDVIVHHENFEKFTGCDKYRIIKIDQYKDAPNDIIHEKLFKIVNTVQGTYMIDTLEEKENIQKFIKKKQSLMHGMILIVFLIGFLNTLNNINHSLLSRVKEFNMMRSVGLTNVQLKKMIQFEGALYAILSSIITCFISIILQICIYRYLKLNGTLMNPHFSIDVQYYLLAILINVCISMISTYLPKQIITKTHMNSSIKGL